MRSWMEPCDDSHVVVDHARHSGPGFRRASRRWIHPLRYHRFMNAICGLHRRDGAIRAQAGDGLDAMLAALGGHGEDGARWTEGMAGLGCRRLSASAAGKDRAEAALCFDRDAAWSWPPTPGSTTGGRSACPARNAPAWRTAT